MTKTEGYDFLGLCPGDASTKRLPEHYNKLESYKLSLISFKEVIGRK